MIANGACAGLDRDWVCGRLGFEVVDPTDIFFMVDIELDDRYLWPPQRRAMEALALSLCNGDGGCARAVCSQRAGCLREALARPPVDDFGVWGGTTSTQRKRLRRVAHRR